MKGSWGIGRLSGISVRIHWTFLILPLLIGWSTWSTAGPAAAGIAVLFVLAIFGCVVLHELGHALAARRYGIGTEDITLLPIGGVARLQRMPRQPVQELVIALAGPAVNVVIAGTIVAAMWIQGVELFQIFGLEMLRESFMTRLMWTNVVLVLFNLLPAFPMDGGRVLRSLLAMALPHVQATRIAVGVGRMMAILFAAVAIYTGSWMLVFIAGFVYLAGSGELAMSRLQSATEGVYVDDVMQRHFQTVAADTRLADLAPQLPYTTQRDFPVVRGQQLVGMLGAGDVLAGMADGGGDRFVAEVMQRGVPMVDRRDTLIDTFAKMQSGRLRGLPVHDHGVLVGVLSGERIRNWLQSLASSTNACAPRVCREGGG
jgi:Zn-dependent protease/CBS domain-containing protein